MGRDPLPLIIVKFNFGFNPRAHVGRDTKRFKISFCLVFQSTRPRGARRLIPGFGLGKLMFQSTRPRGARQASTRPRAARRSFNPRAHVGRDHLFVNCHNLHFLFQSTRPRGARPPQAPPPLLASVSIHAPTWGATCFLLLIVVMIFVSIHAPTWGATLPSQSIYRISSFQSTRPRGARLGHRFSNIDVARFQSTRPRGARPLFSQTKSESCLFQSTRPRGARPFWGREKVNNKKFQSTRPRGARLNALFDKIDDLTVSIHAPTWGATPSLADAPPAHSFNPRAHVGRDQVCRGHLPLSRGFNPRAHVGRDRVFSKCLNITVQSYEKCERFCGLMVK